MLIDWVTVAAQIINFLILVWLMKRFLYQPVLDAIAAREKKIADSLAAASAKALEAEQQRALFASKNQCFDRACADLLAQANQAAQAERERLMQEVHQAADRLGTQRQEALCREAKNLDQALTRRLHHEVFVVARKALGDLAGVTLEARICALFIRRLIEISGKVKDDLARALSSSAEPVRVRCAFALPLDAQDALRQTVNTTFSLKVQLQFETAPDLICGIELLANGQKLAWSLADYLNSLEQALGQLVSAQAGEQKP
jgi:F-type H+-transporting ATPase subunit b